VHAGVSLDSPLTRAADEVSLEGEEHDRHRELAVEVGTDLCPVEAIKIGATLDDPIRAELAANGSLRWTDVEGSVVELSGAPIAALVDVGRGTTTLTWPVHPSPVGAVQVRGLQISDESLDVAADGSVTVLAAPTGGWLLAAMSGAGAGAGAKRSTPHE
jgi:hypothetical protein